MTTACNTGGSCGCSTAAKEPSNVTTQPARRLEVEFLYLDLEQCDRCQGAEASLEAAVALVRPALAAAGVAVEVRKVHVQSEEQARRVGFSVSPTVRINGRDLEPEPAASFCGSCSELFGRDVSCREWTFGGASYTSPPQGLFVEAILRHAYGGGHRTPL